MAHLHSPWHEKHMKVSLYLSRLKSVIKKEETKDPRNAISELFNGSRLSAISGYIYISYYLFYIKY